MLAGGDQIFSVRPVFIGWITLLMQAPLQVFFTLWAAMFFGSMAQTVPLFARGSHTPYVVFGAIAFFGIPAIAYIGKKLNYGQTEYRFYSDRLEFEEGFFSINEKTIRFRDVKEVTLHKGLLQRFYGLGTIYLATLATGTSPFGYGSGSFNPFNALGFGNVSASGVSVRDIADPDQMFDKIRQIVDAQRA